MGQVSDLLMDIKRSWPAPHQNPSLEPPPLLHTHPALCRVRECDLVPIPEEGCTLMTASSDTLRSSEPPSPAGPLSPSGQDPLVHTGRGLQSGLDSSARARAVCTHPVPPHPDMPAVSRQLTVPLSGCTGLIIREQRNWLQTCSFSAVYNVSRASALYMYLHQRRQLRTMEQRRCQSQSNGCVCGGWRGRGSWIIEGWGRSLFVPNVQGDAKT